VLPLVRGARVGVYEIIAAIGEGGMGQVYRATDTTLGRDVAIKILPDAFAADPERLARFEREAKTLASLNHPHIAALYGFEKSGGAHALVMELVDGDDLSARIGGRPMAIDEALGIARQIAQALGDAHDQGIVHRDLKPANIKVRSDGAVKVLDFGLAKALEPAAGSPDGAVRANSPTITSPAVLTGAGVVLGTAAYMSPEQAKGRAADRRSDVWAFGVVLYEMLTGHRPFQGEVVSETFASILAREPDWSALPSDTPPPIRRLLRRCLEKDRRRRLADMSDARLEIDDVLSGLHADQPVAVPTSRMRERLAWALAVLLVAALAAATAWNRRAASGPVPTTRAILSVAPGERPSPVNPLEQQIGAVRPTRTAVALSPDGKTLVLATIWGGTQQLYTRAMDQLSATPMAGTIGASSPFFSPDGQWVGFWAAGELRKVPLSGGPPVTLCKAAAIFGASWGSDGTIVFADARNGGLSRVSANGGSPTPLTTLQPGEFSHRLPHMLPGGRAVVFTISKAARLWNDTQIVVRSLVTGDQTVLITGGADARYVPTGHLVFARMGTLMAVPFDPARLAVTGGATGLIEGVMQSADRNLSDMDNTLAAQFAVSDTGTLVYVTGGVVPGANRALAWVDRHGVSSLLPAPVHTYVRPRLSSDGRHVTVSTEEDLRDVWNYDIARGTLTAVTSDGQSGYSMFSPDGKRVVFRSGAGGGEDNLYWRAADGSGTPERLTTSPRSQTPTSWSSDGATVAFMEEGPSTGFMQFDAKALSIADRQPRSLIATTANEMTPEFSPDGRWLAYVSTQSGRTEVYVQPYPGPGERHLISIDGGWQPAWSRDGRQLFYVGLRGVPTLFSVAIAQDAAFRAGTPTPLFANADLATAWGRSYDVSLDGSKFLMTLSATPVEKPASTQMILVQNWFDELKRVMRAQ
jgi:eukaryotic-like serine/threonine-protein kinase